MHDAHTSRQQQVHARTHALGNIVLGRRTPFEGGALAYVGGDIARRMWLEGVARSQYRRFVVQFRKQGLPESAACARRQTIDAHAEHGSRAPHDEPALAGAEHDGSRCIVEARSLGYGPIRRLCDFNDRNSASRDGV